MRYATVTTSVLPIALALASGCASTTAIVDGRAVPRLDLAFTGQPYVVRHHRAHPRPGSPSSGLTDDGGDIVGRVCGLDIDFGVKHEGDHVQLVGFLDNDRPTQIMVRDSDGTRYITGGFGGHSIDLQLTGERISGHVGLRVVLATASDDDGYDGGLRVPNWSGVFRVHLLGRAALLALPPADQAAILPALLTCYFGTSSNGGVGGVLQVGIGGAQTDVPRLTSSLYEATSR